MLSSSASLAPTPKTSLRAKSCLLAPYSLYKEVSFIETIVPPLETYCLIFSACSSDMHAKSGMITALYRERVSISFSVMTLKGMLDSVSIIIAPRNPSWYAYPSQFPLSR